MDLESGLTIISLADVEEIAQVADRGRCPLYLIDTEGRSGREAFFEAVRSAIPLDPPIHGSKSWDALSDSLWEGLYSKKIDRVIVLWRDATEMAKESPSEYETAIGVLADVARLLADPKATVGRPTDVCVYVGRSHE